MIPRHVANAIGLAALVFAIGFFATFAIYGFIEEAVAPHDGQTGLSAFLAGCIGAPIFAVIAYSAAIRWLKK